MGKLTPFGVALRKLRIDKNMRLFDLAEKISKSAAFLSAVETGRKPIPDGFIVTLSRAMDLTAAQIRELRSAKDQTLKEVKVDHLPAERRELIAAFARRLDELPVGFLDEVRKRVLKSCDGDVPFKRKRRGMVVPPMSAASIAALAENVRRIFCTDDRIAIPIIDILEFGLVKFDEDFVFEVRSVNEMKGDEGMVVAGQHSLVLRQDVYDGACNGEGRDRFTACHELGHYLLHHGVTFARTASQSDPIYTDAEWQADTFAGRLMMSSIHLPKFKDADHAAQLCGMSNHAALVTYSKHKRSQKAA